MVKETLLKSNINECRGETRCNPESIKWYIYFIEDRAFSPSYDLAPSPFPSPSPVNKLSPFLRLPYVASRAYWREEGEGGGGGGAKSYDGEKAWSSFISFTSLSYHQIQKEPRNRSIPRNQFRQPMYCTLAGRYDNPIPTWFLAPIDCLKIPARVPRRREKADVRCDVFVSWAPPVSSCLIKIHSLQPGCHAWCHAWWCHVRGSL